MLSGQRHVRQTVKTYKAKTIINKLSLVNNLLTDRYKLQQSVGDDYAVLKLPFMRLPSMETDFDDSTKLAILISTLEDHNE